MIESKKRLAIELSKLEQIKGINLKSEQYQTESELGAEIVWNAYMIGDIEDKAIYDLGCGNGIFGIGSLLAGASKCCFVDIDKNAIGIVERNLSGKDFNHSISNGDIKEFNPESESLSKTVMMNPPFGTKKRHADIEFLDKAFQIGDVIYSLHKAETIFFIKEYAEKRGFVIERIWDYDFGIRRSHAAHKKEVLRVKISCIRLTRKAEKKSF
jgi:putative methylase